jgi:alkyl hydroperoxide reductase subunit AhpC
MAYVQTPREQGGLGELDIPLLSDQSHKISADYGVLDPNGIAFRGTFIIDPAQVIRHASNNVPAVGRNPDEFVRMIEAMQYFDQHGEVCPANWKKGEPSMSTDWNSDKLKNFWQNVHAKK